MTSHGYCLRCLPYNKLDEFTPKTGGFSVKQTASRNFKRESVYRGMKFTVESEPASMGGYHARFTISGEDPAPWLHEIFDSPWAAINDAGVKARAMIDANARQFIPAGYFAHTR